MESQVIELQMMDEGLVSALYVYLEVVLQNFVLDALHVGGQLL